MNEKEKQLFKALCKFKDAELNEDLTKYATPAVLGQIFFNRMQGIAYGTLEKAGLLGKVSREFRNSLGAAYDQNIQKNQSYLRCVAMLCKILSSCNCNVAMLKGAYLCAHYPDGYRTSNDIDLLVLPKDVTALGNLLTNAGFMQGNVRNGEFVPASRQEIIESKMMRGETVPYIKEVDLPFMKFFEVDINFSLDYKNGNTDVLSDMLTNVCIKKEQNLSIPTLNDADFFIHLCAHLYKEATTLPWIEMNRDMTLYKYCDIYMLLSEMSTESLMWIFRRARQLDMEKVCAYAILETMGLFDMNNSTAYRMAKEAIADEPDFCLKVVSPKDKKILKYKTADVTERFFMQSRANDLKAMPSNKKLNMRRNNTPGFLITFCGLDGCGKTTMMQRLIKDLQTEYGIFVTKQPTNAVRNSEIFRTYMDCPDHDAFDYRSLSLLAASDRLQHVNKVIEPELRRGNIVLSDRYFYSCLSNLRARGFDEDKWIYEIAESVIKPDLAFFFDVPVEEAVARVRRRPDERERFIDIELQHKLRKEYIDICKANGGILISTLNNQDECYEIVKKSVKEMLKNGNI